MFLPSHSGGRGTKGVSSPYENKQTLYLKGQEGRREERRTEAGREGRRGWEEREGKGRAQMLLPLLLFFCVVRLALFVLLTPLAKEFFLTMYTVYVFLLLVFFDLFVLFLSWSLLPYLLFLDFLAQCNPVRGLPRFCGMSSFCLLLSKMLLGHTMP